MTTSVKGTIAQGRAMGYRLIPTKAKRGSAGWDKAPQISARANPESVAVCLHHEPKLGALDCDVSDYVMSLAVYEAVVAVLPRLAQCPIRGQTKNGKWCAFFRVTARFNHLRTKHYKPDEDTPGQQVEAFGGGYSKYVVIAGLHDPANKDENGELKPTHYEPETELGSGRALVDTPPDDLPEFTFDEIAMAVDAAEEAMVAAGWFTKVLLHPNLAGDAMYDLTPEMRFEVADASGLTIDDLRELADGEDDGVPVLMNFLPGRGEDGNLNRARARVTPSGKLMIAEFPTTCHYEVEEDAAQAALPASLAPSSFFTAAKERQAAERGHDPHDWTDAGIQARFAFCPTRGSGMVYEIAKHGMGGMSVTACRLDWQEHAVWDADEEKFINPFGAWIGGEKQRIEGIEMRPDHKTDIFNDGSGPMLNSYFEPEHPTEGGDTRAFHAYFEHMIPDPIERAWFWGQLCHKIQLPEVPGPGTVLVARAFGTGRGTLFAILGKLIGERFMHQVDFGMITGRNAGARFNGWQAENLIVTIEEAKDDVEGDTLRGRASAFEMIKSKIEPSANRLVTVEKKGQDQTSGRAFATFLIATNHADAIKLPEEDRRIAVITCGPLLPEHIASRTHAWMSDPLNIGALYREMMAEDLTASTFEPYRSPPLFAGKQTMIEAGRSGMEQAYQDALAEIPAELVTQASVVAWMERMSFDRPQHWQPKVREWVRAGLHPVGGRNDRVFFTNDGKQRVYARTAQVQSAWEGRSVKSMHQEVAKGYGAPISGGAPMDAPIFKKAKSRKTNDK